MPNWVFNGLTIEGNPEQVDKLVEQMNKPFVQSIKANGDLAYQIKQTKYVNPIFAFWNIIAPTDLEAYQGQPTFDKEFSLAFEGEDWYNWNNRNWGTKWDVAVSEDNKYPETYMEGPVENGENKVVYYNFDTAWSRPLPALLKLSEQYPNLLMTLTYKEESGWGGEMEFLRGVVISESEYDNQCEACEYEYSDVELSEQEFECEDCYGAICPRCGFSYELCQTHLVEYQTKQEAK